MKRSSAAFISLLLHLGIAAGLYLTAGQAGGLVLGDPDGIDPEGGVQQVAVVSLPKPQPVESASPGAQSEKLEKPRESEALSETPPEETPPPDPPKEEKAPEPAPEKLESAKKEPVEPVLETASPEQPAEEAVQIAGKETSGAQSGSGKPAKTAGDGGKRTDAEAKREAEDYYRTLMAWLNKNKQYPPQAKKAKQQGIVIVRFTIDVKGNVLKAEIKKSSGFPLLDEEALEMLKRASPLPPIPASMGRERLTISLPIEFSLVTD